MVMRYDRYTFKAVKDDHGFIRDTPVLTKTGFLFIGCQMAQNGVSIDRLMRCLRQIVCRHLRAYQLQTNIMEGLLVITHKEL